MQVGASGSHATTRLPSFTSSELPQERGPRPWVTRYRRSAVVFDGLGAGVAGALSMSLLAPRMPAYVKGGLIVALPFVWVGVLSLVRGYERRYLGTTVEEYRAVCRAALFFGCATVFVAYGWRLDHLRSYVIALPPLLLLTTIVARRTLRHRLRNRRLRGLDVQNTVVVGDLRSIGPMIREMRKAPTHGMHIVAACVSGLTLTGEGRSEVDGVPVFGYPEEAMAAVDLFGADVVAVSAHPDLGGPVLRRLAWALEDRDVDLVVAPGIFEVAGPRLSIRPVSGMPLLHVERPVMSGGRRMVKHAVDRTLSAALAVLGIPLLLAIALAVRLDSPGPVLFRQKRVGARGETFEMLKFRTMAVDAESRLASLDAAADAGNAVLFKMKNDPRVTRVGRWLRRYSLDELPQFINVLRGEMSLVGPRPPLPSEVARYEPDAVRRLRVRPGLTGLWQVSGRSNLPWDESLRLDLWYVDNWSLILDLQILTRTARAVLRGEGAY